MALSWCIFLSLIPASYCSVQCMSSTGQPVDWFMIYKLPENHDGSSDGFDHFYLDVNSPVWSKSAVSMNASTNAVSYTLKPIYKAQLSSNFMYALYNDEDPNKREPRSVGHSKGVFAFDKTSGFWMVHSTPRFPTFRKNGYLWPHNALRNGQSFLCMSFKYSQLNQVAKQIMTNYVFVYDKWVPKSFQTDNPYLEKVVKHKAPTSPVSLVTLVSMQGTKFLSFAKSSAFGADLYSDLVAPKLGDSLYTETWQDGRGKLASNCTGKYKVFNVKSIRLSSDTMFKETVDHSKWAITKQSGYWVCVGDINRQEHQEERGGGTVCLQNKSVWNNFYKSISDYEKCQ